MTYFINIPHSTPRKNLSSYFIIKDLIVIIIFNKVYNLSLNKIIKKKSHINMANVVADSDLIIRIPLQ